MKRRDFLFYAASGLVSFKSGLVFGNDNSVIKKRIPKTGEMIPAIGMGTWITFNVGENITLRNNCTEVMNEFLEAGGGMVDSSPMYGSAEDVIGYTLNKLGKEKIRSKLFATSKIWTSSDNGLGQFQDSRRLWALEKFELFKVHNLVNYDSHYKTLQKLKKEGKIKYLGITTSHGRFHEDFERIMKRDELDFIQLTYNITHRLVEDRLLKVAADRGIAVIANRPYDGGRLMDDYKKKRLPPFALKEGISSWADFFLKFIISHPSITCAIPATSKVAHMKENMQAGRGKILDQKLRQDMIKFLGA